LIIGNFTKRSAFISLIYIYRFHFRCLVFLVASLDYYNFSSLSHHIRFPSIFQFFKFDRPSCTVPLSHFHAKKKIQLRGYLVICRYFLYAYALCIIARDARNLCTAINVNARVEEYRIGTPDIITGPIFHVQQCSARRIHLSLLTVFTLGGNALQETRGIFRLDTRRWVIYNARRKVSTRGSIASRLQSAALPIVIQLTQLI